MPRARSGTEHVSLIDNKWLRAVFLFGRGPAATKEELSPGTFLSLSQGDRLPGMLDVAIP